MNTKAELKKGLIFTATLNEADNIKSLLNDIQTYAPNNDVMVVDDASKDGTGQILDEYAKENKWLIPVHRPRKLGLGTAHKYAMKYALQNGYDYLITMDADYSHHPRYLPEIIKHLENAEFVIGSRYVKGGQSGYKFFRTLISKTANYMARFMLQVPLNECTTAYRGFRMSLLSRLNFDMLRGRGYSFFVESIFYISLVTKDLTEFPINFEDRRAGSSKINRNEIIKGVLSLFKHFKNRILHLRKLKARVGRLPSQHDDICTYCGGQIHSEIYPAQGSPSTLNAFQCTSTEHKAHEALLRCLKCGLYFIKKRYSANQYTELYENVEDQIYAQNIEARYTTFRYNLKAILPVLPKKGNLLDVGAYCGAFLKIAQEAGFTTTGVEPSSWATDFANKELKQNVLQGTLETATLEKNSYDVITMWDVLEHVADPVHQMKLVKQFMKPDGIFLFSTLMIDNWYAKLAGPKWPWLMDMHLYYFTTDLLKQMLNEIGFEVVTSKNYCHIITLEYFFSKLKHLGIPGAGIFEKIVRYTPLRKILIPFRFGDIQLFAVRQIQN